MCCLKWPNEYNLRVSEAMTQSPAFPAQLLVLCHKTILEDANDELHCQGCRFCFDFHSNPYATDRFFVRNDPLVGLVPGNKIRIQII